MTQLEQALQVKDYRNNAISLRSELLRSLYEAALADYKKQYNEEPWLIIAKEAERVR